MRKIIVALFLFSVVGVIGLKTEAASAISGSEFQAGRIMDDGVFFDPSTYNPSDIQNFLNSKVPVCDTNGDKAYGGTTRAAYGASRGNPAPFVCLRDYAQSTPSKSAETGLCNAYAGGYKSAAQIIYDVSQACGVNPKVLIVLLEKEQSLITDDWPWNVQYRSATGYGCPDTAPCDAEYYGFFNQVYSAARQFKKYSRDSSSFRYRAYRDNYIQYNPDPACGNSSVYIQNQATAGLYNYTPYQPNPSALNNLYGSGDSCSAYGNRNFWRLYRDWFGSTYAGFFQWSYDSHAAYVDDSQTVGLNANSLNPNQRFFVKVRVRNMGSGTWYKAGNNPVRLATNNPRDRQSSFCDNSWINCSRVVTHKEDVVYPGQYATFEFWMKAPGSSGLYVEQFNLVAEGATWLNDPNFYMTFSVNQIYSWQYVEHQAYRDGNMTVPANADSLGAQQRIAVRLRAKNTGSVTWNKSNLNLGTSRPLERQSAFCDATWISCSRVTSLKENSVAPGETGTFEFWAKAPSGQGLYREYFNPVAEGVTWLNNAGFYLDLRVTGLYYLWDYVSQAAFTDSSKTTAADLNSIPRNSRVYLELKARNMGNTTWLNSGSQPVRLGTSNPRDHFSPICDLWLNCYRSANLKESSVTPGETGTFEFWVRVPNAAGLYREYFNLVAENAIWLNDLGQYFQFNAQ